MNNTLYLPLSKKESLAGWIIAPIYIVLCLVLSLVNFGLMCLVSVIAAVLLVVLLRDFVKETIFNVTLLGKQVWLKPLLAVVINIVVCTAFNDLLLLYQVPIFVDSDWGPVLWDVRAAVIAGSDGFWWIAVAMVLVVPVVEELIFRQLIFTTFHPISKTLATFLSVVLFVAFHAVPFLGATGIDVYIFVYAFQFIPMGLLLCWLYQSTDSIVSPILMHILRNALLISTAMRYMT